MLINSQTLAGMNQGFRLLFKGRLDSTQTYWEKLATKITSSNGTETYAWLSGMPEMRKWIGDREVKNLSVEGYTIRNEPHEATIGVSRDDIEDDNLGVYRPQIEILAETAKRFPDKLVTDLMKHGSTAKCYDGQPFFSENHKVGIGKNAVNIANFGKKKLSFESYGAARTAMLSLANDEGATMDVTPGLLVVPPALEGIARKILFAQQIEGTDNIHYKSAELLVLPKLAGNDTEWYLLDVSKSIKPFIVQERRPVEFTSLDKPGDEAVFMKNLFLYGVNWRGSAGYALWQLAYKSDGTVA